MAKRWTVSEALVAIASGDITARTDIGRRFPLFATASPEQILAAVDLSVRVVEKRLRGGTVVDLTDDEDDSDDVVSVEVEDEAPARKRKPKAAESENDDDEEPKAAKLPKRGRRAVPEDAIDDDDDDFAGLFDDEE